VRALLQRDTTVFQYTHGVSDQTRISPDSYTFDQYFLDRPGNDAIQVELLHNYQTNPPLYEGWHEYFRKHQPRMLIVWGKNDPFFTMEGAKAYLRDLPEAELHWIDTGHFALEDNCEYIADRIRMFLNRTSSSFSHERQAHKEFQPPVSQRSADVATTGCAVVRCLPDKRGMS
jgi:pimeloyl-ACP methyl ester carboxylesterase